MILDPESHVRAEMATRTARAAYGPRFAAPARRVRRRRRARGLLHLRHA